MNRADGTESKILQRCKLVSKDMLTFFAAIHCLRGGTSGTDLRGNLFSLPSPRGQMQSTPESVTGT